MWYNAAHMPRDPFSPERLKMIEQKKEEAAERIEEQAGNKTPFEPSRQDLKLIKAKESLEREYEQLLDDAYTEARLVNVLYDLEGKYPFVPHGSVGIEDWIRRHVSDTVQIGNMLGLPVAESMEKINSLLVETASILEKDRLEEQDFERFTDVLGEIRQLRTDWEAKLRARSASASAVRFPTENENRIETNETHLEEITPTQIVRRRVAKGVFDDILLGTSAVDGTEREIPLKDPRLIGPLGFTKNRRNFLNSRLPHSFKVERKILDKDEHGTQRYEYRISEDEYRRWQDSILQDLLPVGTTGDVEIAGTPVEEVEDEFLPPGEWVAGAHDEASQETGRAEQSVSDPERMRFLQTLKPVKQIVVADVFGRGRKYSAFVFERNDEHVVVVATDRTQNADYVFSGENDDWISVAQRSKLDILTGSYPSFIGRLIHTSDWQDRLQDFLAGKRNTLAKQIGD